MSQQKVTMARVPSRRGRKLRPRSRAEQARRVRGWEIRLYRVSGCQRDTYWSEDVPPEWAEGLKDETVTRALLKRSGRTVDTYQRSA